ncbi:hypothetical protein [Prosthecodimorpha staleyi]|uniref:Uncharacterized protein n=1 Tax=Prosthecodimorpha staleyi TaxID=2840188 RepID=A0A947D9M3_9HYPH|nr:hypothetical protein [Prosthecodimorpha staleyi]MBT9290692.1 hypothetical protein [Prosthecodimorpha staleyi]
MARLVLHIGMTKTGSTSIEATFDDSRDALVAHGIDYLDMGQNHSKLMTVVVKNSAKGLKGEITRILGVEKGDTDYDPELVLGTLRDRLAKPRANTVVISGQGLVKYNRRQCERVRDFVSPYFDEIRIVVYVRDPTTWASSRAQENMKRGHTLAELVAALHEDPENCAIMPEYRAGIEAYIEVFGRENVDIRVFDRKRMVNGDLMADFCAAIGAGPEVPGILKQSFSNKGASMEALLLIQAHYDVVEDRLRAAEGAPPRSAVPQTLANLIEAQDRYRHPSSNYPFRQAVRDIRGTKWALPKPVLDTIWAKSMADIEWLRGVTGDPGLFADAYPPAEAPAPAWNTETLQDVARALEEALGDVMQVEKRRSRLPGPARQAIRMLHKAKRAVGLG